MPGHRGRQYMVWGTMGQYISFTVASRKIRLGQEGAGEPGISVWSVSSPICGGRGAVVGGAGDPAGLLPALHPPTVAHWPSSL